MRIRKNAKLSPLLFSSGGGGSASLEDTYQTHVCQLNQSPWDVIPFGSDSPLQFEGEEDSFTGNGSLGDSVGAVESVASMMDADDQKPLPEMEDMVVHDNAAKVLDDSGERRIAEETTSFCQKTDGKNWHCKNEAKQGQSFCEHHLSLLRSYNNNNSSSYNNNNNGNSNIPSSKKAAAAATAASAAGAGAGARRAKARAAKRASTSSSSNPYEFYYYSGFGPLWGKRRGDRNGEGNNSHRNCNEQLKGVENSTITEAEEANEESSENISSPSPSPSPSCSSSQTDNQEFDYEVDDDEEDEEEEEEEANGDGGKKRMRKPVKARSLKSLM